MEPIRKSLLGSSGALRVVAGAVAGVLNGIVRTINGIPMVKDLPYVRLPHVEIPGLTLPKLELSDAVQMAGGRGLGLALRLAAPVSRRAMCA
ncbi:MAG TPA: hypothetical protein PLQ67_07915 [Burkholderiaceae bacterium]|nr:hypothetical protein [Burkholderiaceae bacterium]